MSNPPTSDPGYINDDAGKLVRFVSMYCDRHHKDRERTPFVFKQGKTPVKIDQGPPLCAGCTALLRHAIVMRVLCPLDPKPRCRNCPQHCYRPNFREEMERVMKYSGPRSLFKTG